jgi:hypothetical protein
MAPMKSKLRLVFGALTGAVLLVGLLPGCSDGGNPKIVEVPNLKELESKVERTTEPPKELPPNYGKGEVYQKAFEKRLERLQGSGSQ